MRYRADTDSLAASRAAAIERAKEEYDRKIDFLFSYFGKFADKPEAERLAWYLEHDTQGELQDFLMQMAALGPWQAKEARWRLRDASNLYEQNQVVIRG